VDRVPADPTGVASGVIPEHWPRTVEQRPVVALDHPHARAHHAGELEHGHACGERVGGEGRTQVGRRCPSRCTSRRTGRSGGLDVAPDLSGERAGVLGAVGEHEVEQPARGLVGGLLGAVVVFGRRPGAELSGVHPRQRSAGIAAQVALPRVHAFAPGDGGDDKRSGRVGPPPSGNRVRKQTEQERNGEVRAEYVLIPLAHGRA